VPGLRGARIHDNHNHPIDAAAVQQFLDDTISEMLKERQ